MQFGAFLRNPHGTVVGGGPFLRHVLRIEPVAGGLGGLYGGHEFLLLLEFALHLAGEGHAGSRTVGHGVEVFIGNAPIALPFFGNLLFEIYPIGVLHFLWLAVGLAVEVDGVVAYFERLSGQSYAALHIVFAAVGWSGNDFSVFSLIALHFLSACLIDEVEIHAALHGRERVGIWTLRIYLVSQLITELIEIVGLILWCGTQGVAGRIVEHHDIVEFHFSKTFGSTVVPVWPFDIALTLEDGQCMLCEWKCEWCFWNAWSVAHLRNEEVVARQQ